MRQSLTGQSDTTETRLHGGCHLHVVAERLVHDPVELHEGRARGRAPSGQPTAGTLVNRQQSHLRQDRQGYGGTDKSSNHLVNTSHATRRRQRTASGS